MSLSNKSLRIIVESTIPYIKGRLEQFGTVTYLLSSEFTNQALMNADAVIVRTGTKLTRELLSDTPIKLICTASIGFDHIDTAYCAEHGIRWYNAPGCNALSVQQYVVSSLLLMAKKYDFDLKDKTIGIVGVGNVGSKVADACRLLGMTVLLNDPPRQGKENSHAFYSLDELKETADIISFHTPLIKEGNYKTYHLADEHFFATLGKQPLIINSARGSVVETNALKEAIRNKKIRGAVIDCWENEPNIDRELLEMVDIATPHIAGYSADGKANGVQMALEAVCDFLSVDKSEAGLINLPLTENTLIDMNRFPYAERFKGAFLETYDPRIDMQQLRDAPETFAKLRNHYPLRREYKAFTLKNGTKEECTELKRFGFNCQ